jgi:hypothetical protein
VDSQGGWTTSGRRMWLWPVAALVGFPIGGLVADVVVDGVDSVGAAIVAGLVAGAIVGAAQWFALRRWVSWLWIAGLAVGLAVGAATVDYGIAPTATVVGVLAAVVRFLGLARWPFLVPPLARANADPASSEATREATKPRRARTVRCGSVRQFFDGRRPPGRVAPDLGSQTRHRRV